MWNKTKAFYKCFISHVTMHVLADITTSAVFSQVHLLACLSCCRSPNSAVLHRKKTPS